VTGLKYDTKKLVYYSDKDLEEVSWQQQGAFFVMQGQRFTVIEATKEGIWLYKVD
jgi:hypothetical protein